MQKKGGQSNGVASSHGCWFYAHTEFIKYWLFFQVPWFLLCNVFVSLEQRILIWKTKFSRDVVVQNILRCERNFVQLIFKTSQQRLSVGRCTRTVQYFRRVLATGKAIEWAQPSWSLCRFLPPSRWDAQLNTWLLSRVKWTMKSKMAWKLGEFRSIFNVRQDCGPFSHFYATSRLLYRGFPNVHFQKRKSSCFSSHAETWFSLTKTSRLFYAFVFADWLDERVLLDSRKLQSYAFSYR